jgi:hypothetical protein
MAEQAAGKRMTVRHIPEDALRDQYASATNSLQKSFAALMLSYAAGGVVDMTETLRAFPGQRLKSVRDHFQSLRDARPA